jgi:hypothetical protein
VTTRLPPQMCLSCGRLVDAASDVEGKSVPKPGDVTICIGCAHVMVFTEDLKLREPTAQEAEEIAEDDKVARARWAIMTMRAKERGRR